MKVVVLHKGDSTTKRGIDSTTENILQMVFSRVIQRVGFAGKHDLHGASEGSQDARQSVRVIKDQFWTLIIGKPPGESNGERCRIQQRARGNDPSGRQLLLRPQLAGALSNKSDKIASQCFTNRPQVFVWDQRDSVPEVCRIMLVLPIGPKITFK